MIDGLSIDHFRQIQFLTFVKISVSVKISVWGQNFGLGEKFGFGQNFNLGSKFRFGRFFYLGLSRYSK